MDWTIGRNQIIAIATAAIGVYVLLMAGATTAITNATAQCSTWPTCNGQWLVPLNNTDQVIAWVHRVIALGVGLLVLWSAILSRSHQDHRIRWAHGMALLLYPIQIGIGALTVIQGPEPMITGLHLGLGLTIFSSLLFALAWTLEHEYTKPRVGSEHEPAESIKEIALGNADSQHPTEQPKTTVSTTIRAYIDLMKPRLMWLLSLVAIAGMGLAAGQNLTLQTVLVTLGGGVLAIGASGTFNHILERDIDEKMDRTADRPLPTNQISSRNALIFGLILSIGSVGLFLTMNVLAAALGAAAIVYYSIIYTLVLKPNTPLNTVIGGFAGAFPALIGAAAATNTIGTPALLLAAVIFLWTPAHFYNLALAHKDEYGRAGLPMLPVVRGDKITRTRILLYFGATLFATSVLATVGDLGPLYAVTGVVFGSIFLWTIIRLHREQSKTAAFRAFHASNAYLGALLVTVVLETIVL